MEIGWNLWGMLPHSLPQKGGTANIKSSRWPGIPGRRFGNAQVDIHEGNPDARLSILVRVEGDDTKRLERIANERGQ